MPAKAGITKSAFAGDTSSPDDAAMAQQRDQSATTHPSAMSRGELGVLAVIILIGAAMRLLRLGESLWYDEIAAWIGYGVRGPAFIVSSFHDPSNHVLHTLLSWLSVAATESWLPMEFQLRLPAFVASLAAIPVVFALARRTAGREAAFIAGTLMAIWPVCVLEGAEARGYSMMMLFSALMSVQLLIACEKRSKLHWTLYAVWCALGVWAHIVTVCVPLGHGVWLVMLAFRPERRGTAFAGLLALVAAAILTLGLYAPMLSDLISQRTVVSAGGPHQPGLLGPEGLHLLLQFGGSWLWYASLPGLALVLIGMVTAIHSGGRRRDAMIASLIGVMVFVLLVMALGTWVYARFALFALPGAALAGAIGWMWVRDRLGWVSLLPAVLLIAGAGLDLATRPPKQPIRDAVEFIMDQGGQGSRVLGVSIAHSVLDAYIRGSRTSFNLGENLDAELSSFRPEWVVVLYPDQVDASQFAVLEGHGFVMRTRFDGWADWGHGDVLLYEHEPQR